MLKRHRGRELVQRAAAVWWLIACTPVWAQWTAFRLLGPSDYLSRCLATNDQQQGGWRQAGQFMPHQPVIWSGSAGSEVNLATSPTDSGEVNAVWQGYQGGIFNGHASIWQGTAQSRVDLDPGIVGTHGTWIRAMRDTQQVGYIVAPAVIDHAAMWMGSAASFVDLHPAAAGTNDSFAYATDGLHQGGVATIGSYQHAALWSGSAASFVDLNPFTGGQSFISGMAPGQQVGWYTTPTNISEHAAIWSGTASSLIDLHPFPGSGSSFLLATTGQVQVGESHVPGGSFVHAGVWFGTAASFVDLHSFLPAGYGSSEATSVYQANGLIYVGGTAANPSTGLTEAFLWVGVPAPSSGTATLLSMSVLAVRRRRPPRTG